MTLWQKATLHGFLLVTLSPGLASAQNGFDGTWKLDLSTIPYPKRPLVWLVRNGVYQCQSCMPAIRVSADGRDHPVAGQSYDTISVAIVDGQTIRIIEKKNKQIVSDEKFSVSADGETMTDEFANWEISMRRTSAAPHGSRRMSGTWQPFKIKSSSDRELLLTFELRGDVLSMSRPSGQSYHAELDGPDATYIGEPRFNGVSVTRIDAETIEEKDKFDGKVLSVSRMTIAANGRSMHIRVHDLVNGTTQQFAATKQ